MTRLIALLLLLSMLPACATRQDCAAADGVAVPFTLLRGRPMVPVLIDDAAATMMLDTGATHTGLTSSAARSLGTASDPQRRSSNYGVGGFSQASNALLGRFRFGSSTRRNYSVPVSPSPDLERAQPSIVGVVGADILADSAIDLDLAASRMTLYPITQCATPRPLWNFPHEAVPARLDDGGRLVAAVQVDGQVLLALLDTGANASVMTRTAALRLGVTAAMLDAARAASVTGSGTATADARPHRFTTLRLGPLTVDRPVLFVLDQAFMGGFDLVIGTNILGLRRFWLSHAGPHLFISGAASTTRP